MCRPVLAVVTRGLTVAGWVLWVFVLGPSLWAEAGCWRCAGCLVYMLIAGVLLGQRGLPCVAAQGRPSQKCSPDLSFGKKGQT